MKQKFNDFVSNSLKQNYEIISILTLFIKPFFGQILKRKCWFYSKNYLANDSIISLKNTLSIGKQNDILLFKFLSVSKLMYVSKLSTKIAYIIYNQIKIKISNEL